MSCLSAGSGSADPLTTVSSADKQRAKLLSTLIKSLEGEYHIDKGNGTRMRVLVVHDGGEVRDYEVGFAR